MTTIYQRSEFHLTRLLVEISSLVSRKQPDPTHCSDLPT